ncbi:hypothetical protein [Pararhizobium sp. DWP1-1-3]|uniref:hypothetical protein n=1 Tax=Pararhizobium sp. DWP1-1-3 TaxID=2804652 RepID=UPI003CF91E73
MKLFIAKLTYKNGDRAHPWSLFASTYADAVARLEQGSRSDEFSQIAVKERPITEASIYGRDPQNADGAILEHPEIVWVSED